MSNAMVTLVTGASSGIGREIARLAAQEKRDLLLIARREERLRELKEELETTYAVEVYYYAADLSDPEAPQKIYDYLSQRGLRVEHLINNAGFGHYGLFHEQELARNTNMIQLNVTALVALTRLLLPDMVARGEGRILNVASTAGMLPGPLQAIYYSTKAFVVSFSQAIAHELRDTGVTSTVLCPGPVKTEFAESADLEGAELFRFAATPERVAKVGRTGMLRGKLVVSEAPAMLFLLRFVLPVIPRRLMLALSRKSQQKQ